jgi:hypothetical protein
MVTSFYSKCSILIAITTFIIGGRVAARGAPTARYLYHPHHLYHHEFFEPFDHDLHHDLISTLGKGQNNTHEDGQTGHSYHTKHVLAKIHQPKSVHHSPVDNPSKYEHHHMSNKTIPAADQ